MIKDENGKLRNKTFRETYSKYIGKKFQYCGYTYEYSGGAWDPDTGKKQYLFYSYNEKGEIDSIYVTDYRGFREVIDGKLK